MSKIKFLSNLFNNYYAIPKTQKNDNGYDVIQNQNKIPYTPSYQKRIDIYFISKSNKIKFKKII